MDFRKLAYIVEVAKEGSVTAAANKLYISQPALSQILAQVEKEVGMKLFDRKETPMRLTYAGELYLATAKEILTEYETLKRKLLDVREGDEGQIKLGIPVERAGYMLPEILTLFQQSFPKVSLKLEEHGGKTLLYLLKNHEVDLVILPKSKKNYGDEFDTRLIYEEEIFIVSSKPLVEAFNGSHIDVKNLKSYPFILVKEGHAIRTRTNSIFEAAEISPEILLETTSNLTAVQMAQSGLGLAIVPKRTVDVLSCKGSLFTYSIGKEKETWDVELISLQGHYFTRSEEYLIKLMQEEFKHV
ncbi:MAG: LysR family transcriptional regulator [Clostridiaceae bacterium]